MHAFQICDVYTDIKSYFKLKRDDDVLYSLLDLHDDRYTAIYEVIMYLALYLRVSGPLLLLCVKIPEKYILNRTRKNRT